MGWPRVVKILYVYFTNIRAFMKLHLLVTVIIKFSLLSYTSFFWLGNCCFQKANKKPTILSVTCTFSVPTGFLLPYLLLTTDHYSYLSTENWLSSVQKSMKGLHEKLGSSGFMHKSLFECPTELLLPPINKEEASPRPLIFPWKP